MSLALAVLAMVKPIAASSTAIPNVRCILISFMLRSGYISRAYHLSAHSSGGSIDGNTEDLRELSSLATTPAAQTKHQDRTHAGTEKCHCSGFRNRLPS